MKAQTVKDYFEDMRVVCDYARAAKNVGLWESEKILIEKYIPKDAKILELGCGAGRISLGLAKLGYKNILASDFSSNMVDVAKNIAQEENAKIDFKVIDATKIPLENESFHAVIFGFNGLMQIPTREARRTALESIKNTLKRGGFFIFTTHDRSLAENHWKHEKIQWELGNRDKNLDEFGDIFYAGDHGNIYIHAPVDKEIKDDLECLGFEIIFKALRSDIADESFAVKEFSDECVFRVARKT